MYGVRYHRLDKFKSLRSGNELKGVQINVSQNQRFQNANSEVNVSRSIHSGEIQRMVGDEIIDQNEDAYNSQFLMN